MILYQSFDINELAECILQRNSLFRSKLITKTYRAENILGNKPNENEIVSDYNRRAFIMQLHHKTAL